MSLSVVVHDRFSLSADFLQALFARHGFSKDAKCWTVITAVSKDAKKGHEPRKASILDIEHIENWLVNAGANIMLQLVVLFAWHGSLRPCEVYNLKFSDNKLSAAGDLSRRRR